MASTMRAAICGALGREGTDVVLKMRRPGAPGPDAVRGAANEALDALFVYKLRKAHACLALACRPIASHRVHLPSRWGMPPTPDLGPKPAAFPRFGFHALDETGRLRRPNPPWT